MFLILSFRVVGKNKVGIVKRFKKYHRTVQPGIAFIIPVVEMMYFMDTKKEEVISTHFHSLMTSDGIVIKLDIKMTYHIEDAKKVTYDAIRLDSILKTLVLNSLMSFIQEKDFHQLQENKTEISEAFHSLLSTQISEWGLTADTLELSNIEVK